jgi:putative salt-induced outer membrane protein
MKIARRTQMRRSLLCALLSAVFAAAGMADQVTLKNGDRLSGDITSTSEDGKTLLLKTEFAGDITIQWDAIVGIESAENLNLTLKDGTKLSGKITTVDGKFVVAGAPTTAAPAAKDAIVAVRDDAEQKAFDIDSEKMAHPKFYYFWSGLFDTGLALTRGNSSTASYTLDAKAVRETPRDKLTLYSNYIFADNQVTVPATTTANLFQAGVRGDLNVGPRFFVFAFGDFMTNQLQHLSLRQDYGGGVGYHIIKTDNTTFDVFAGADYDRDAFSSYSYTNPTPPPPVLPVAAYYMNSAEALVGEEFDSNISKRTTVSERFSFFPNLSHTGEYRMQFDAAVALQMKTWLSWQTTFSDRYISYPPPGLKGNDLVLSTGFRVAWGKVKL